jgi:RimJ/RimL family protein N-acetyltransferase
MWPETLRATGMLNYESALKLIDLFAKWVYRRAAAIRVISPGFKANLVGKGVSAEKIHVISNWVDTAFFRPLEADPALAQKFGLASRFNIMYAGTIGLAQGLDTFIEAAELLKDIPDLQFVLVGDGADLKRLQGMAAERQINNVGFLGRHPIEMMPHFYSLADVLFLHLRDDPLFRITIPHKIFTYLACGKPILVAVEGDASQVILDAQAGMVCPPSNPAALADTVLQLYRLSPSDRRAIGENGRRAAVELYTRENLVAQIEKMIGRASQNKSRHKDLLLSHLFYLQESHAIKEFNAGNSIDAGYTVKLWRPGRGKIVPPQLSPKPFLVWWLFHQLGIFKNEDYAVLGIYKGDKLTHRSSVFPGYFRFPFMAIDDLQIGDTWTAPDHRCRGLSTHAIHQILRLCGKPGRRFWYVTDKENIASIRVVEKTGFSKVGEGCRTKRLGHSLFGTFSIMA